MLFIRELKRIGFSIPFWILIAGVLLMAGSQDVLDFSNRKIAVPQPGEANYGTQTKDIPEIIIPAALQSLAAEYSANRYTAYPAGFYKSVRLNEDKQRQMAAILSALTGREQSPLTLKEGLSYEQFKSHMAQADKLIGGGSSYADSRLREFGRVPITYEEAVESYNQVRESDRFTGAYARLFTDYTVIPLSILPVFIAVAVSLRDRRAGMSELIFSRAVSSASIVLTRYCAIVVSIMLPVILISYVSSYSVWSLYDAGELDFLAPLRYDLGWLLPSVMMSAAAGMFLTELTRTPVAIAVQGLWWFIDVNGGLADSGGGGYSLLRLMPRHNTLVQTQIYLDQFDSLVANRLLFAAAALMLAVATVFIYEQNRRGKLGGRIGTGSKVMASLLHRKSKSAA